MGGWISAEEAKMLDHWTGKTAYTVPSWYVGESTTQPTDAGASFTEPVAGAYARKLLVAATWTAATAGDPSSTSYGAQITKSAATGGWGTLGWTGLFSVATLGTGLPLFWGTMTAQKAIQTNDTLSYSANTVFIKLGDPPDTY